MKLLLFALLALAVVHMVMRRESPQRTREQASSWARFYVAHPELNDCVSEGLDWHSLDGTPRRPKGHRLG